MKFNTARKPSFLWYLLLFFCMKSYAQTGVVNVTQDPKFEQLLNEKRKYNNTITATDRYKIQIYTGDSESSKKQLLAFKKDYPALDATIIFSTPQYKVLIGNFKSRIEAERNLMELKKKFPKAFIVKPSK